MALLGGRKDSYPPWLDRDAYSWLKRNFRPILSVYPLPIATPSTVKDWESSIATTYLLSGTDERGIAGIMTASVWVRASICVQMCGILSRVAREFSSCNGFLLGALLRDLWNISPNEKNNFFFLEQFVNSIYFYFPSISSLLFSHRRIFLPLFLQIFFNSTFSFSVIFLHSSFFLLCLIVIGG